MDLSKSYEFFKPEMVKSRVHIIGCGSVGSTIAENLARCGITKMTLWDFDRVEAKNVHNQMFRSADINRLKVDALKDLLVEINPEIGTDIELKPEGWHGEMLSGYIFLAVDGIELRREIAEKHKNNNFVKAMFDVRTLLTGAQHYAADWRDMSMKKTFIDSMQFSHDEAVAETPVSACGVTLGIVTTVRLISAMAVNNFIKFIKGEGIWRFVNLDGFEAGMECF